MFLKVEVEFKLIDSVWEILHKIGLNVCLSFMNIVSARDSLVKLLLGGK